MTQNPRKNKEATPFETASKKKDLPVSPNGTKAGKSGSFVIIELFPFRGTVACSS